MKTMLCIKWGTAFSAEEVNVLCRAAADNVTGPLRFVCLSDTPEGLDPAVEYRPIPDIGLSDADIRRPGVWRKLALYHSDLHDLGPVLFIDLDMMVVGSMDSYFETPDQVTFLDTGPRWRPVARPGGREAGTGIFAFDPQRETHVLDAFLRDPQAAMDSYQNEQDFVSAHIPQHEFWPDGWIVSFKRHLCYRNGAGLFRTPRTPSANTSVVAFHGTPRPSDTSAKLIWGPAPHWHRGSVPWIEAYRARYLVE